VPRYYEFEISLPGIEPRIWRRLLIRTAATFADLHKAIRDCFGWQDYHLWVFRLPTFEGRQIAGIPEDDEFGRQAPDGRHVKVSEYFADGRVAAWCEYVYDFGDNWVHEVKLVRIVGDKTVFRRRMLDGARACPPEDCGGVTGYERLLRFLRTGKTGESGLTPEQLRSWLGDWTPDGFDLAAVKATFDR